MDLLSRLAEVLKTGQPLEFKMIVTAWHRLCSEGHAAAAGLVACRGTDHSVPEAHPGRRCHGSVEDFLRRCCRSARSVGLRKWLGRKLAFLERFQQFPACRVRLAIDDAVDYGFIDIDIDIDDDSLHHADDTAAVHASADE